MKAMIFAAGLGTRLKPLTDTMPKAMVPVAGKPLVQWTLLRLKAAGFDEVVINVHHFAQQIVDFVTLNHGFGCHVQFSDETGGLLETGGGIKKAAPLLAGAGDDEPFLIHNVDILSNVDLADFYRHTADSAALLLVSERKTTRYLLFDDSLRLVGWVNEQTGQVKSPYPQLDVAACHKYAFAGIHTFSPRLFQYFGQWPDRFSVVDFYLSICHQEAVRAYPHPDLRMMDVGKADTLLLADEFLRREYTRFDNL